MHEAETVLEVKSEQALSVAHGCEAAQRKGNEIQAAGRTTPGASVTRKTAEHELPPLIVPMVHRTRHTSVTRASFPDVVLNPGSVTPGGVGTDTVRSRRVSLGSTFMVT